MFQRGRQAGVNPGSPESDGAGATTALDSASPGSAGAAQLLVLEAGGLAVYPVPQSGALSIGRAEDCQVKLRDPLASRHHATLHVSPLAIEDHGSANGTRLGRSTLDPGTVVPIQRGEAVHIGNSLLIVRRVAGGKPRAGAEHSKSGSRIAAIRPHVVCQPAMLELYALVDRLARGSINVLVLGETGVGKEVVTEALHQASPRRDAPLVRINCAALAEPLLESELFGHERGAFTGAVSAKEGLLEAADGGTVFLDEVGELPPSLQAKLLRVIEGREVTRVGSVRARPVDVRFVSATNKDLQTEVDRGAFRADLLYRLNGASVQVPPLRERLLELEPLAEAFVRRVAAQIGLADAPVLTAQAMASLMAHSWPGNVRELRNVIERSVLICDGASIEPSDLALGERSGVPDTKPLLPALQPGLESAAAPTLLPPVGSSADTMDRARIVNALLECGGNQSRAAKFLGVPRRTLVRRIAQLGLPRPRESDG